MGGDGWKLCGLGRRFGTGDGACGEGTSTVWKLVGSRPAVCALKETALVAELQAH